LAQSVRLKSGRSGGCWTNERHVVLMSTGWWSELSTKDEVRYTWEESFLVITMSKISRLANGLYGLVAGLSAPKIGQEFPFPRLVFSREFQSTCLAFRSPAIKTGIPRRNRRTCPLRSVGGKERGKPQDFHRFAGHCDLNCSSLQVGQARNGHLVVYYTTAYQGGCNAPCCL
jgi:hypothetical protein